MSKETKEEKKFIQFLHISLCVLSSTSTIKRGKEFLMGEAAVAETFFRGI